MVQHYGLSALEETLRAKAEDFRWLSIQKTNHLATVATLNQSLDTLANEIKDLELAITYLGDRLGEEYDTE